jgi:hypothetical protein
VTGTVAVANGGTGAIDASDARTNLGVDAIAATKSNLSAAVAPAVANDSTQGYSIGSTWLDTTAQTSYQCLSATVGAAVWKETTSSGGGGSLPLTGTDMAIGDSAVQTLNGTAVGVFANGSNTGTAVGYYSNAATKSVAVGYMSNGYAGTGLWTGSVAIGYKANAFTGNGKQSGGVAIGYQANARQNSTFNELGAVAVGWGANGYVNGIGIGRGATGYYQGVAVGMLATGTQNGVAIGFKANGYVNGTALGYRANAGNQNYSFAKGGYSRATRFNEEWKGSDTLAEDPATGQLSGYNKFGYGQCNFTGTTLNATATEIFLGGATNKRFILQDKSAVCFTAHVVAIDTTSAGGSTAAWIQLGKIKRRTGAATTALIMGTAIFSTTEGTLVNGPVWAADTTNGALKVTVTGVASATVMWNISISYSEVRE